MRDALRLLFLQMQEIVEGGRKRFRIPGGLDGFMQTPTAGVLEGLGGAARAALLRNLAGKIEAWLRPAARSRIAPDLETLAEGHAMQAGPRPMADAALQFRYGGRAGVRDVALGAAV